VRENISQKHKAKPQLRLKNLSRKDAEAQRKYLCASVKSVRENISQRHKEKPQLRLKNLSRKDAKRNICAHL